MTENSSKIAIGIGFMRCGTSWLNHILYQHPEVNKEKSGLHYFNRNYKNGRNWYFEKLIDLRAEVNVDFSTSYSFESPEKVAERIVNDFPDAKLVFSIRNPKDRAVSDFLRLIARGDIEQISFQDAIIKYPDILERSRYSKILKLYLKKIPLSNVHIICFDDIHREPNKVAVELFEFLGVNPEFSDLDFAKKGSTYSYRNQRFETFLTRFQRKASNFLNKFFCEGINKVVRRNARGIITYLRKINESDKNQYVFSKKIMSEFNKEVAEIEELLDLNLSHWKNSE